MTMRQAIRATAIAGVLGTAALLVTPTASAAPDEAHCVTSSDVQNFGRGEITVCVEDGRARVAGNIEDLLPGGPFTGGDSYCVGWFIRWETASGDTSSSSPVACPHFPGGKAYIAFDYDATEKTHGPKDVTGVTSMRLTTESW
ncbi:hypothetical protein [Streptomyces turgidiscabies]|uniref:Secreted protein n=1 Tax=Streptomyces turgidiscabies TaxID=85558 RepID=A0ABU0S011_9ACTN|nr:hypothetical protein [Streptomyces turgidiscabies]MDQ0937546.1 hypothetical protein [Streptomyces turgidiscabies]